MEQADAFFKGEGNAWLKRNAKNLPIKDDLVLAAMGEMVGTWTDKAVLEIGCADGWRLAALQERFGFQELNGIDPSADAVKATKKRGVEAERGFAHALPYPNDCFDVVIYGFCLYLVDRPNLFKAIAEGDRVLKDGGLMIVYDLATPMPCKNPYKHQQGLSSYKQDYAAIFAANPAYNRILTKVHIDGQTQAVVLKKRLEWGWPACE